MEGKMIDISAYRETTRYSCGAASALMILNFFKTITLTRKNEFELWKEALALPFKFSSVFGLATIFVRRGLKVNAISPIKRPTQTELKVPFKYENIPKTAKKTEFKYYTFYREIQIKLTKQLGVNFESRKPLLKDIVKSLKSGNPVIVHVDDWWLRKFIWKKKLAHITHWVVVRGFNTKFISIVDPAYGRIKIPLSEFPKLMDTEKYIGMQPAVIKVSKS